MKKIFSFRLYLEGLKRIRLLGFAAGIVFTLAMSFHPLVELLGGNLAECMGITLNGLEDFANFWLLHPIFTVFIVYRTFSFLNKRNASDFYHSIPYKRTCVFFSYLSAAYTWIIGILGISLGVSRLLWSFTSVRVPPRLFLWTFGLFTVLAFFVGGFVLLAKTMTGTAFAGGMLALILMTSFRVIGGIVVDYFQNVAPFVDLGYTVFNVFSLKTSLIAVAFRAHDNYTVLFDSLVWVYNAIVILLCHAAALYFFIVRKSELAGSNASGRGLQHFYSLAFSLPFALLAVVALMNDGSGALGEFIIIALVAVTVFYLSELISYKKIVSAFKATPLFLIVVTLCGVFVGGSTLYERHVNTTHYEAEEIRSVRFYQHTDILDINTVDIHKSLSMVFDTPHYVSHDFEICDREIVQIISEAWENTLASDPNTETLEEYRYVAIELNNGDVVGRRIGFTKKQDTRLKMFLRESKEYVDAITRLPEERFIESVSIYGAEEQSKQYGEIWESFVKEYNALDQKAQFGYIQKLMNRRDIPSPLITESYMYRDGPLLTLHLKIGRRECTEYFEMDESFPETRKLLMERIRKISKPILDGYLEYLTETPEALWNLEDESDSSFSFQIRYKDFYTYIDLRGSEFTYEGDYYRQLVEKKVALLKEVLSQAASFPDAANNQCIFAYRKNASHVNELESIPVWVEHMDGELFVKILRLADCKELSVSSLRNYLRESNSMPMQMILLFPDGRRYSLGVDNSRYHNDFWEKAKQILPLLEGALGDSSSGRDGTVDIYLTNGHRMYFSTFKCKEFPEEVLQTLDVFS